MGGRRHLGTRGASELYRLTVVDAVGRRCGPPPSATREAPVRIQTLTLRRDDFKTRKKGVLLLIILTRKRPSRRGWKHLPLFKRPPYTGGLRG